MKRNLDPILYLLLAVFTLLAGVQVMRLPGMPLAQKGAVTIPNPPGGDLVRVERVIDGDTIVVAGHERVRYIGMDAPETQDPNTAVQCYGKEAYEKNRDLVEGKYVRLETDVSDTDTYGRYLRYVWVYDNPDGTGTALFINGYLVREGYARVKLITPDVKYGNLFKLEEAEAKTENKGLWDKCK